MAYIPDPTDPTQPLDTEIAKTAAPEFRSLKGYIDATIGDIINGNGPVNLHTDSTIGGQSGSTIATIGYRDIPKRLAGWARGECLVQAVDVTLELSDVLTGYVYSFMNVNSAAVTLYPGTGVDLKVSGENISAPFVVAPFSLLTLWCDTDTSAVIAAIAPLTSGDITALLGYTPYDAANPAGYLTGIDFAMVVAALGYTPPQPNGLGATGTWPIGITGNAVTSDSSAIVDNIYYQQVVDALGYVPAMQSELPAQSMISITSQELSIPAGPGATSAVHGSAAAPITFQAYWVCKFAEGGWLAGDKVTVEAVPVVTGEAYTYSIVSYANTSRWGIVYSSNQGGKYPTLPGKGGGGATFEMDPANWKLQFSGIWAA